MELKALLPFLSKTCRRTEGDSYLIYRGSLKEINPDLYFLDQYTNIPTYIHTNIPTYIHTNIPTYQHTNIHTYQHTNLPTYQHTNIPTYQHTNIHTNIPTYQHTYQPIRIFKGEGRHIFLFIIFFKEEGHLVKLKVNFAFLL
uniref:Enterin neuropeptide n=1 Tax=Haematococcus lacustris TaxID=44745 RepID=A0A2K9YS50_HAELA|nr:Enterin neuropeptide [Haematococcus lacustris]AUW36551.1 Enterin neuropeptide [Haematococcus lacustris]